MEQIIQNSEIDFLPKSEWQDVQWGELMQHLHFISQHSPFYKKQLASFAIEDLQTFADFQALPTTSKRDLAEQNEAFFAASPKEIVEFVTTSGTTGSPVKIALTQQDIQRLAYNEARSLHLAGITDDDIVQITTTLDQRFMAGMAYYLGLQNLGATSIRIGHGHAQLHFDNMEMFEPTAMIAVPSFLHKLGKYQADQKLSSTVKSAICIGEPLRNADFTPNLLAQNIAKYWPIKLFSTYASSEIATAFTECEAGQGGHLLPELAVVEILDENGKEMADGELGEVTVTPLGITGMPLLRYRTGDLARLHTAPCSCGRTTPRLGPIEGRKEHMLKVKGTTIFPQQIQRVLQNDEFLGLYFIRLHSDENGLDAVTIFIDESISGERQEDLKSHLRSELRVSPFIEKMPLSAIKSLVFPPGSRKPKTIADERNA